MCCSNTSSVAVAGSTLISPVRRGPLPAPSRRARITHRAGFRDRLRRSHRGSPALSPVEAVTGFADRMKSSARSAPMSRGRRCVPPAPGMMPSVTSGNAKRVGRRGDAIVAGQRDLESAAHHRAVHRGDDRNFERFEAVEQRAVFNLARRAAELADVGAGEEGRAFAQQHARRGCRGRPGSPRAPRRRPARTSAVMVLTGGLCATISASSPSRSTRTQLRGHLEPDPARRRGFNRSLEFLERGEQRRQFRSREHRCGISLRARRCASCTCAACFARRASGRAPGGAGRSTNVCA